ncbi:TM205 protein, partial [Amia calva]|nr:TM205 protein [Amia calva]
MPTDREPTMTAKLLHLVFLSTFWGMQIWVTFISGFVMDNNLNRHTFGYIQSRLFPFYFHMGSACAFFNLTIFTMYHPSDLLDDREAFQKSKVGPGSYRVSDFIELLEKRPGSVRGVCEAREERFRQQRQSYALGPGSYGKGGIPWAALEEKRNQSAGTCPSMDFDSRKERFQQRTVGSDLGPGTYNLKTSTELLLGKSVSKRGPYDLFTGRRDRPVSCGYFAEPVRTYSAGYVHSARVTAGGRGLSHLEHLNSKHSPR